MGYMCPECGGTGETGKKRKKKCKLCKGKKIVNENVVRQRSGKPKRAVYRTALDGTFERVEGRRRNR